MATPRFAWGIDIGNRALKAIKLVNDDDRLRIDDVEVLEHEQILSSAGDNKESLIQTALANFVQHHPVKGGEVGISVSGQSSFARFIKLPPVEARKIPEIVRFEAIQQIPFPLADVEWSYQLFQEKDSPDIEVGIFAMRKELVKANIQHFANVGMDVQVVQMSPLAVYNAMYYDQRLADGTTMVVDLGAENTDLIIADGETVWLRTIPIGGNNFSEVLAKQFKLNSIKAEELKRNARTSKYARQIFQAMRPVFADLVAEIQRSIGFYASVHREAKIKRIIALGGTFRLPTLMKYLQQNLQIDVQPIDSFNCGAPADGKLAALMSENLISLSGAYGLALQAMGNAKISSSLLPDPIRRAKVWREKTKWFATAAAVIVLGTVGVGARYYMDNAAFQSHQADRDKIDSIVTRATKLSGDWDKLSKAGTPDRTKIVNVNSMVDFRDFWPILINDLRGVLPPVEGSVDTIKAKYPVRGARNIVAITGWVSNYQQNVQSLITESKDSFDASVKAMGGSGVGGFQPSVSPTMSPPVGQKGAAIPAGEVRGFLIRLEGTTPNAGGASYLTTGLVAKLAALRGWQPGRPYSIERYSLTSCSRVKDSVSSGPGGMMSFRPPGMAPGPGGAEVDPFLDPIYNEPGGDDYEFKIGIVVTLDQPAAAAPAPAGGPLPKPH